MDTIIRQEKPSDHEAVFQVVEAAFKDMPISDQSEPFLVNRLRKSEAFVPELSLVAEVDGKIVGHILVSKVKIKSENGEIEALSLAPVSVIPNFQNNGIGSALTMESHRRAKALGFQMILLVGHPAYYPRFGYERASKYGIKYPFDAPNEACMVIELQPDALQNVSGEVVFPKAFFQP